MQSDSGSVSSVAPPLRTWRPMILWSAAILVALGLIWFATAVVVMPYLQVRAELSRRQLNNLSPHDSIDRLGGSEEAARKLGLYLRMPDALAGDSGSALDLLKYCRRSPRAAATMIHLARHGSPTMRASATLSLVNLEEKGLPTILDALDDSVLEVRLQALDALRLLAGNRTADVPVSPLVKALKDPDPQIRWAAATALGGLGPKARSAVPQLLEALKDHTKANDAHFCYQFLGMPGMRIGDVRMAAVSALGAADAPEAVGPIIEALLDPDADMRACAAMAFEYVKVDAPDAGPALLAALKDASPSVRCYAAVALGTIRPRPESAEAELRKLLDDRESGVQLGARHALDLIQAERAVQWARGDSATWPRLKQVLAGASGTRRPNVRGGSTTSVIRTRCSPSSMASAARMP